MQRWQLKRFTCSQGPIVIRLSKHVSETIRMMVICAYPLGCARGGGVRSLPMGGAFCDFCPQFCLNTGQPRLQLLQLTHLRRQFRFLPATKGYRGPRQPAGRGRRHLLWAMTNASGRRTGG